MQSVSKVSVVLPSYNPDQKLLLVVNGLLRCGFTDIIIINDGSHDESHAYFEAAMREGHCTLLTHTVNKGKGAALKTGFAYFLQNRAGQAGVVTVDGDNQHKAEDAAACAQAMIESGKIVLGARSLGGSGAPWASRVGNWLTKGVVRTLLSLPITDTQTGLRAIPGAHMTVFLRTPGQRYEYETNMILDMKRNQFPYMEIPISTVYIANNAGSHFNRITDSLRIYAQFAKYIAGSVMSFLIDISVFYLLVRALDIGLHTVWVGTVLARAVSSLANFAYNRRFVFQKGRMGKQLARYYALCVPVMLLSMLIVSLLTHYAGGWSPGFATAIKIVVDSIIFLISYFVQKYWVFRKKETDNTSVRRQK